jgi:hypothetical protein
MELRISAASATQRAKKSFFAATATPVQPKIADRIKISATDPQLQRTGVHALRI